MARSKYVEYQGFAVPPGDTILQYLEDTRMSQAELGRRANIPPGYVQKLVRAEAGLSVDMALRIERATESQLSARLLLRIEIDYRLALARIALQDGKPVPGFGKHKSLAEQEGAVVVGDPDQQDRDRDQHGGGDDQ